MRRRPWSSSRLRLDLVELGLVLSATALYLVVIAAVSLTAAAKESRDVRGGEIDEAKAELAVLSAMALQPRAVGAPARRQELSEGARRELDAVMARLGAPANGHRVRFWRPDGTILYRSPGDREPAPPPPVRRARLGDAWSAERRGPRDGGGALVTYVPVVTRGRLDGVLEAAHPLQQLRADEATERNGVLVFFGAVGAVVWLGLLPLGVRLARMVAAAWDPVGRRLLRRMRRAITDGELELHYQPKMDLSTGTLDGVEALVRWRRDGVLVPPGEFLGVIEQSPLIRRLTLFVLDGAVRQAREWEREGRPTRVAVNLAAVSLADAAIVGDVAAALRRHDVEPSRLTLEITETAVLGDEDTAGETLAQLAELGVCLSVDDFGTGHSSLARVTRYPFDELKIDRSFVTLLTREKRPIVATIIRLAKTLGLRVVAEGVEDEATLNALRALGCDVAQGYLLAPPAPAADLPDAVRALSAMTRRATGVRVLLDEVRVALGVDAAFVAEFVDDRQVFHWTSGDAASFGTREGDSQRLCESYCDRVVAGVLPNIVADAQADGRTRDLAVTHLGGIGSYVGVPLHRPDGTLYGTLCGVGHGPRADLSEEQVATLERFGRRISPLLASAHLAVSAG